jgi:hypothetical protein
MPLKKEIRVKTLFRLYMVSVLLGMLLVGSNFTCPDLTSRLCLHVKEWFGFQSQLAENLCHGEELDKEIKTLEQRRKMEQQVVNDLKAHKLSLLEAAARFRDLSPPQSELMMNLLSDYHGCCSVEERFCRSVISRAGLEEAPRLEMELERLLILGELTLPESRNAISH